MELKLATKEDLPKLKLMFNGVVQNMQNNEIFIWNEYYPFEEFENDIENSGLYIIESAGTIVASFALLDSADGSECFTWKNKSAKSKYISRIGVNSNHLKQGIGSLVLYEAEKLAKENKAKFLRLLVVDCNTPAINLYLKNGYTQVPGIRIEEIPEQNKSLVELGFEKQL